MDMLKFNRKLTIHMVALAIVFPAAFIGTITIAAEDNSPISTVCVALAGIMPCAGSRVTSTNTTPTPTLSSSNASRTAPQPKRSFFGSLFSFIFDSSTSTASGYPTATIIEGYGGRVNQTKDAIILVQAPGDSEVYRIMGGKKFLIPTKADNLVFGSYGFNQTDVISISREMLLTYPRIKFVTVVGTSNKTIYYLTEGGMLRRVLSKKVFESYSDVDGDIALINAVEFSLYPKNQYIFNQTTTRLGDKPQVYIISGITKQMISYDQLAILGVNDSMITPVNQTEFDAYKTIKGSLTLLNF